MSTFGDNLRKIRKERNMTQDELAVVLGTSKQVLSRYENGQRSPKVSVVSEYAEKLGVPINALTDAASPFGKPIDGLIPRAQLHTRRVPILGDTAAGEPVIANRVYDEWVEIPDDGHHFDAALRVTGYSMTPKYHKGDLVFVKYQDDVLGRSDRRHLPGRWCHPEAGVPHPGRPAAALRQPRLSAHRVHHRRRLRPPGRPGRGRAPLGLLTI